MPEGFSGDHALSVWPLGNGSYVIFDPVANCPVHFNTEETMTAASAQIDLDSLGNPRFKQLLDEEWDTHKRKAAGYSGSDNPDTWANFREAEAMGLTPLQGCVVRLGDKMKRTQSLMKNRNNDQVGESLRDTLMDLANYAHIAVCLDEEERQADPSTDWQNGLSQGVRDLRASAQWAGEADVSIGDTRPVVGGRSFVQMQADTDALVAILTGHGMHPGFALKVATEFINGRKQVLDQSALEHALAMTFQGKLKKRFWGLSWQELTSTVLTWYNR